MAGQTAKATESIKQQIIAIQSETQSAVDAIATMCKTLDDVKVSSSAIANAVNEQSSAITKITKNAQQAADGTQKVSSNISTVTRGAKETGISASQMLTAASELAKQSEVLLAQVDEFLFTVRSGNAY